MAQFRSSELAHSVARNPSAWLAQGVRIREKRKR